MAQMLPWETTCGRRRGGPHFGDCRSPKRSLGPSRETSPLTFAELVLTGVLPNRRTAAVLAGLHLITVLATAQTDYRNLDAGRPVVTEDAYPVERYAFELRAPYRFEADAGGRK